MFVAVFGGFLIGFPLFWMAIAYLISRLSGWSELARDYPAEKPASGETFSWCSARLRPLTNYSGCLNVTVSAGGIHLQTFWIYRPGHEPIFIPWDALYGFRVNTYFLSSSATLTVRGRGGGAGQTVVLYGKKLVASMEKHFPQD